VVNIVTGDKASLGLELAKHDAVDGIWAFGPLANAAALEKASAGNLKQTWTETAARDWSDDASSAGRELLGRATQVKNIWVPWGE
jgi:aldehyde dehydrogenase (NAD+)